MSRRKQTNTKIGVWRLNLVRLMFIVVVIALAWRLADIQILNTDFLRNQGDARHLRTVPVAAHRGMVLDRHGEPLAISTPVHSIWLNPQEVDAADPKLKTLAKTLKLKHSKIKNKVKSNKQREFVYLKRRVTPELALAVQQLNIAGVELQREYKRFYPTGEVASHVVGFTDIDDAGQEGLELAYNDVLSGVPGLKRMVRDSKGNYVEGGEQIKPNKDGQNINLSIDLRLQYLTYQALKAAVKQHHASSASAVILDVHTGEVLAMVNQPSFNPNNRRGLKPKGLRNRAITDVFEPGSTVKPFTVAAGLKADVIETSTIIDTRPGTMKVSGHTIKDFRDYGQVDLATLMQKSSNVGVTKIALSMKPDALWQSFAAFGMAEATGAYFPGEVMGSMPDPQSWRKLDRATLAYGYGLATTALQLARAYTVLGSGGIIRPVSFVKLDDAPIGRRVYSTDVMQQVRNMMEKVVQVGGTAQKAAVANYKVAGKTGTIKKAISGGYAEDKYSSSFAGLIPATNPKLAMVVVVDEPKGDEYYGGLVAAPVFSQVMTGAMRLLNIAPDDLPEQHLQVVSR